MIKCSCKKHPATGSSLYNIHSFVLLCRNTVRCFVNDPYMFGFPRLVFVLQGYLADPRALAVTLDAFQWGFLLVPFSEGILDKKHSLWNHFEQYLWVFLVVEPFLSISFLSWFFFQEFRLACSSLFKKWLGLGLFIDGKGILDARNIQS